MNCCFMLAGIAVPFAAPAGPEGAPPLAVSAAVAEAMGASTRLGCFPRSVEAVVDEE